MEVILLKPLQVSEAMTSDKVPRKEKPGITEPSPKM